jgi:hypothetical protein
LVYDAYIYGDACMWLYKLLKLLQLSAQLKDYIEAAIDHVEAKYLWAGMSHLKIFNFGLCLENTK